MGGNSLVVRVGVKLTELQEGLRTAGQNISQFGDEIIGIGLAISALSVPLLAFGRDAVRTGMEFESAMSNVRAVTGANEETMARLESTAREMGRSTVFSANQVADAMGYMGLAGWNTQQIMGGLEGILNLSASAGMTLAESTRIMTGAITAFGYSATDATHFADVMARVNKNANTTVHELGQAFKYVAPMAGMLGFSLEDTAIALGAMANQGMYGSRAGTSLAAVFTELLQPTAEAQNALNRLGIEMFDSTGEARPLIDILDDMRYVTGDMTEELRANYLATVFGRQGFRAIAGILNTTEEDWLSMQEAIRSNTYTAEHFADILNDNLAGRMTLLRSEIEETSILFYQWLQPALEAVVAGVNTLVTAFNNAHPAFQNTIFAVGTFIAILGPATIALGGLIKAYGTWKTVLGKFSTIHQARMAQQKAEVAMIGTKKLSISGMLGLYAKEKIALAKSKIARVASAFAMTSETDATLRQTKAKLAYNKAIGKSTAKKGIWAGLVAKATAAQKANTVANAAATKAWATNATKIAAANKFKTKQVALGAPLIKTLGLQATAILGLNGAMVKSKAAIGGWIGAMKASKVAMGAKKAVMALVKAAKLVLVTGGLALIPVALGAVAYGAYRLWDAFMAGTRPTEETRQAVEELASSSETLRNGLDTSLEAFERNRDGMERNNAMINANIERLQALSVVENLSLAQRREMQNITERLNNDLGTSVIMFDQEGRAIGKNVAQFEKRNKLRENEERFNLYQQRSNELGAESTIIGMEQAALQDKINTLRERIADDTTNTRAYKQLMEELKGEYAENELALIRLGLELDKKNDGMETAAEKIAYVEYALNGAEEAMESYAFTLYDLNDTQRTALNHAVEYWTRHRDNATNAMDYVNTGLRVMGYVYDEELGKIRGQLDTTNATHAEKLQAMINNMQNNREATQRWGSALAEIARVHGQEFANYIERTMGIEAVDTVEYMKKSTDGIMGELYKEWQKGAESATTATANQIGEGSETIIGLVEELGRGSNNTIAEYLNEANFSQHGQNVVFGLRNGINDNAHEAQTASRQLAETANQAFEKEAGINSPSRVYRSYGEYMVQGLVLGIESGFDSIRTTLASIGDKFTDNGRDIIEGMDSAFRGAKPEFLNSVETLVTNVQTEIDKVEPNTASAMTAMNREFTNGFNTAQRNTQRARTDIVRNIQMETYFRNAGQQAMAGLNQGLLNGERQVMATANRIANNVRNTMQQALRVNSPSREMEEKVGLPIMQGLARGLEGNEHLIKKALHNLSGIFTGFQLPDFNLPNIQDITQQQPTQPCIINLHVGGKRIAQEIVDDITQLQALNRNQKLAWR